MRLPWRRKEVPTVPDTAVADASPVSLEGRLAEVEQAREETRRVAREIRDRSHEVAQVSQRWAALRAHNHFGDTIAAALRGRDT